MPARFFLISLLLCLCSVLFSQSNCKTLLFVGSYTEGKPAKGIYVYAFDQTSGSLTALTDVAGITNPSWISVAPNGQFLYACTDTKLAGKGSVTAFKIDSLNGKLLLINKQSSEGENPVYVAVDRTNRYVINGNYTEGTVSVLPINPNGSLNPATQVIQFSGNGIHPSRQNKAHIHATVFSPDQQFLFLPDLGTDKIRTLKFNPANKEPLLAADSLSAQSIPGSGPRHLTFHPNTKFAYCIEELSGMITVYVHNNGKLDSIQRILSYSKTQDWYGSSDIHISPDGNFLYASNRWDNENTLSIFSIDQASGKLTLVGHQPTFGDHPRNFTIDPSGKFLLVANQVTGNIIVFKRDLKTGLLTKTIHEIKVPLPSCLQMRNYNCN